MERKTWRRSVDGYEDVGLRDGVSVGDAICDLAAYEDTGLEPEEINQFTRLEKMIGLDRLRELAEADKDGRCVVPPCKVGDTVYQRTINLSEEIERIYESTIKNIVYDAGDVAFDKTAIGQSIFLTRESAEAALEEKK